VGFLLTLGLTFLLVFAALLFFLLRGPPIYRLERDNVIQLLELVVSGQASVNDWEVFVSYPIRHDLRLADIQERCMAVAESHYLGRGGRLFTAEGIEQLDKILAELKQVGGAG